MQQSVVNSSQIYPYRNDLETLIYPYDPWLGEAELFYKDDCCDMDSTGVLQGHNDALACRHFQVEASNEIDMEGPLHLDICQQDRFIMNGVDLGLRLWPSKDSFSLMSSVGDSKVEITQAVLKVCNVDVSPSVLATHNNVMKHTSTAKYSHERSEMKTYPITPGLLSFGADDMFQGEYVPVQ